MFLIQAAANNGFPSEIKKNIGVEYSPYEMLTEKNLLTKLKRSREHCEEGRYRGADKVVSDLRGRYVLYEESDLNDRCKIENKTYKYDFIKVAG